MVPNNIVEWTEDDLANAREEYENTIKLPYASGRAAGEEPALRDGRKDRTVSFDSGALEKECDELAERKPQCAQECERARKAPPPHVCVCIAIE